ncbi:MAG: cell division protein SepF [Lachnospiraceae bacterium]|jgi:cell division inhibitor SepF|nr:cell division protein SepF [Lachnospiraceae bacterium]
MSAIDKVLNAFKMGPDSDPDDDMDNRGYLAGVDDDSDDAPRRSRRSKTYDDDDEEEDDRPARRSNRKRESSRYDDDDEDDEEDARTSRPAKGIWPVGSKGGDPAPGSRRSDPAPRDRKVSLADPGMEVGVYKPTNLDEAQKVIDTLLAGQSAVLNLEGLDIMMAQRIIDFVGGANYAMKGNFTRISNFIFLFTPHGVDIAGDVMDEGPRNAAAPAPSSSNINIPG